MSHVVDLSGGLDPLRTWFDDKAAFPRLLAVQATAAANDLLDRILSMPELELRAARVVTGSPARRSALPALAVFSDREQLLARAIARRIGWRSHIVWDTYLVYRPGALWTGPELPPPDAWFHRSDDAEVFDPERFKYGEALRRALVDAVIRAQRRAPVSADFART